LSAKVAKENKAASIELTADSLIADC